MFLLLLARRRRRRRLCLQVLTKQHNEYGRIMECVSVCVSQWEFHHHSKQTATTTLISFREPVMLMLPCHSLSHQFKERMEPQKPQYVPVVNLVFERIMFEWSYLWTTWDYVNLSRSTKSLFSLSCWFCCTRISLAVVVAHSTGPASFLCVCDENDAVCCLKKNFGGKLGSVKWWKWRHVVIFFGGPALLYMGLGDYV